MIKAILFVALFGMALGRSPLAREFEHEVVHSDIIAPHPGGYQTNFELSDGSRREESGVLKDLPDGSGQFLVMSGSYTFTAPDGTPITITWVADENGYRAEGASIPTL